MSKKLEIETKEKLEKDILLLEDKLVEIKDFYEKMQKFYSIKSDLIVKDENEDSLAFILEEHLKKNQEEFEGLKENIIKSKEMFDKLSNLENYINEMIPGIAKTRLNYVSEILSDNNLKVFNEKINVINNSYAEIFQTNGNLPEIIKNKHSEIIRMYNELFDEQEKQKSKYNSLIDFYKKMEEADKEIFLEQGDKKSRYQILLDTHNEYIDKNKKLEIFYKKIFGDEKNEITSLEKELNDRIESLKDIENEAKKVIALSSDAGLASGFHQRGKKAFYNKIMSLIIFCFALTFIGVYNFETIKIDNLHQMELSSFILKIMLNAPFIWIATVANINLNKYARLEEEYAHKESLAKSFERYKEEISKLNNSGNNKSDLLEELLRTNIEAFKVNPAQTMHQLNEEHLVNN